MRTRLVEPSTDQVLAYCADEPVERVFLEDVARRGTGHFAALEREDGSLQALCHLGTNVVPSGEGCEGFAELAVAGVATDADRRAPRGRRPLECVATEARPCAGGSAPAARVRRPPSRPSPAGRGCAPATPTDLDLLVPACARAHHEELGVDPLRRDANGFRWRTRVQIEEGRSWLWVEDGVILFKAEASAWTPTRCSCSRSGSTPPRAGWATRPGRCATCSSGSSGDVPAVCLFVRAENAAAIRLYETVGMRHVLDYRSVLL